MPGVNPCCESFINLCLSRCSRIFLAIIDSSMYLISTAVVSWNGVRSDQFKLCTGVKQGGVISPLLFSVYIDPLLFLKFISKDAAQGQKQKEGKKSPLLAAPLSETVKKMRDQFRLQRCLDTPLLKAFKS